MRELSFIVNGQPMSKKRNYRIFRMGRKLALGLASKYKTWERDVVDQLEDQRMKYQASMPHLWAAIWEPVEVSFVFHLKDKAKYDLSNLYQGPEDALVKAGILADDSLIESHDGSRKIPGMPTPRIIITIRPFKEDKK